MRRYTLVCGLLALTLTPASLANGKPDLQACKAMQATIAPREAEIAELTAKRDASARSAEDAGIAWEDAEIHRLVSSGHADAADRQLAAYDDAKQQFARDELALQSAAKQFNTDVSAFNTRCSSSR